MRKIESQMNDAITNNVNWKSGNTEVVNIDGVSYVYLHGNKIAEVGDNFIRLYDGGWQTATTKSRLNAILKVHGLKNECIYQKAYKWFLRLTDGSSISFFSSMRLA
jgi:hypothetical protein